MTIYKYPVDPDSNMPILLPMGAYILSAGIQNGEFMIWVRVDPSEKVHDEHFVRIYGTGHTLSKKHTSRSIPRFLNTIHDRGLVFHAFEE